MTIQSRSTLKAYFDNGDTITATALGDVIDSFAHLADTTAQTFNSEISTPNLVAANVSAGSMTIAGRLTVSAATFTGRIRQGVSAAASAADSRGDFIVVQESTVAGAATAQVAFLPGQSNVISVRVKVLTGGSAGAGGLKIHAGIPGVGRNALGTITVSANGLYEITSVTTPANYTAASGGIEMVASGASANTNILGVVSYYKRN